MKIGPGNGFAVFFHIHTLLVFLFVSELGTGPDQCCKSDFGTKIHITISALNQAIQPECLEAQGLVN